MQGKAELGMVVDLRHVGRLARHGRIELEGICTQGKNRHERPGYLYRTLVGQGKEV